MKKEAAKKNRKWLLPVIIAAAVLVIAGVLLAIFLGPWNQGGTQSGGKVESKLYWNVDRLQFVEEETGFSIRDRGEDGLYSIRFAVDGEQVELKTADKRLVNSIDMLDLMGLIFDADGLIVDLVLPTDVAVETAFDFFVQEVSDTTVTINSSMAMTGMSMTVELAENTGVYNVTPKAEVVGQKDVCELMDKVQVYSNEAGEVTHVFITERNPEAGIYFRQDQMYDSLTGDTTREPDANGVYTLQFAHEGELVDLKCKDKAVVSLVDSQSQNFMGLLFDEEGYIIDVVNVATALRGKQVAVRYHVTAVEGDMITMESIWYYNRDIGNVITHRVRADADIFIEDTACGAEYRGQRVDGLQVNDFVNVYTDLHDEIILAVIQTRMVESDLYYNIDRSWNGQGTKRTPDENGWYVFRVIAPTGLKEYRTKDKAIADKADKHYCFGLKLKGDIILDAYDPKCVTGCSSSGINYYVSDVSGPITRIVYNTDFEKGNNYMSAEDCLVFDVSDRYSTKIGTKTTMRVGDKVTAYGNISNELTHVYITSRYIEGSKIYYHINRLYDSTLKETKRVPDADGYYVFDMICEGKTVQVKTKDKGLATYIDAKPCAALLVSGGIIKDAAIAEAAIKYGIHAMNYYYIDKVHADGTVDVYYGSVDNRTYRTLTHKLSSKTKIYNVGDGYLNYKGEITKLQKGDYVYGYAAVDSSELEVVFVMGRKMDTKLYWQVSQKYNSTTKETTREPNAEGYYVYDLLVDGQIKQFKTKDKAVASKVDSYSQALGLRLDGDIILQAYGPESIKGLSGVLSSYYDVMTMNGNKLHLVRNQVNSSQRGKETDIELAANYKVYNVSPSAKTFGEPGTIGIGDRLYCLADDDGKASVIFILFKSTHKAGAVSYCEHCDQEVWWEPYGGTFHDVEGAHYYLTADMSNSERSVGYTQERLNEDPTKVQYVGVLDLNGFTLTSANRRNYSIYSTLTILDTVGGGKLVGFDGDRAGGNIYMYQGSTLNIYGGELCGSGADVLQTKGGVIFANGATINLYDGKIAGGRAQLGGNIYMTKSTLNVFGGQIGGDIHADLESTVVLNGKVTIPKGSYEGVKLVGESKIDVSKLDPSSSVVVSAEGVFTTESNNIANLQNAFVPLYDRDQIVVEGKALSYVEGEIPQEEIASSIESWIAEYAAAFEEGTNLPETCPCCVGLVSWIPITGEEAGQITSTMNGPKTHFYLANDMEIGGDYRFLRSSEDACLYLNNKELIYSGSSDVFHGAAAVMNIFGDGNVINNGTGDAAYTFNYNGDGLINIYGGTYSHNNTASLLLRDVDVLGNLDTHVMVYAGTFNVNPATYDETYNLSHNNIQVAEGLAANSNGDGTWTIGEPIPDVGECPVCNEPVEWEMYTDQHKTAEDALTAADGHKHYKLAGDISYRTSNGVYALYIADGTACFDLAGYDISRGSGGESGFYNLAGTLNIIDSGREVEGEPKVGSVISSAGGAVETGSGSAVVNIYGGKFHKFSGYAGTSVIDINAGGTVNLYDGIVTTDGVTNNAEGSCVWLVGDADNKAVFNMYGGTVTVGTATCSQAADEPGGAICVGRQKINENYAEANILGGTVTGGDLADAIGDTVFVANGCSLTIGGTAVINGEVATGGENASVILSGAPKIVALEGGNGLFLNGALANIDALEAGAQIQVTPKAGDVLTVASENAAAVENCFTATNGREIDVVANQLVVSAEQPDIPLVPGQLPTTCPGCGLDIGETSWTAITEITAPAASSHNSFIYANTSYAKAHCYLANDITLTDAGYSFLNAFGGTTCLYLNGKTLSYSGSSPVFRTVANTLNIYGEGAVINNADTNMFDFNGTGRVNILGGEFVQNGNAGMFEDLVVTEGQTTHALISGGKFNCDPAALNFTNANVLTIAEGFMSSDNGDGTWSIVEGEPEGPTDPTPSDPVDPEDPEVQLPTICPGCGATLTEADWTAITGEEGGQVQSGSTAYPGAHFYLADSVVYTGTYRFFRAGVDSCLYLNGHDITYSLDQNIFHTGSQTLNIFGEGNVTNNGTGPMFAYNGAGRVNIYGGNYTQTGTAGMFEDKILVDGQTTHVMIYGGTFNVNPAELTFTNGNVVTVAEGYQVTDNGDGTWTVAEPTGPVLPTTCPGCGATLTEADWTAFSGEYASQQVFAPGQHIYLTGNYTQTGVGRAINMGDGTANALCWFLNGYDIIRTNETPSYAMIDAGSKVINIFGDGNVTDMATNDQTLFRYSGAGEINIYGGNYTTSSTGGMFRDYTYTGTGAAHVVLYGGTFGFNPAELTFTNSNVLAIAEGYEVTDNGDGTWTIEEGEPEGPVNPGPGGSEDPENPENPELNLPTTCPGCGMDLTADDWTAITEATAPRSTSHSAFHLSGSSAVKAHCYLANDITVANDAEYAFLQAFGTKCCLFLNGKTLTNNGTKAVFMTGANTLNIFGEGTVINNADKNMFDFNGAGRVNILGGEFVQNGNAGMFEDLIVTGEQTTHALISGGKFNVNPAELTFTNENVVTIAEGYEVTDNGNGTWTVAEPAPVVLPTTCPGCGMDLAEGDWTPWSGEYGSQQVFAPGQHIYLTGDYTQTGVGRAINMGDGTANALCWFLNGYDIIRTNETPSYAMIDAGSKVINIFGDGNVTDMATNDQTLFRYSGAGEINIYGGNYTTSSTGGMFRDYTYTGTGAAHVVLYGGAFGFNPAELTFTNSNVLAIAEGYEVTDNGDGTWTVAEKALDLPTTCPGCQAENVVWTEVTGEEGKQIWVGNAEFPNTHYYIAKDITLDAGNNKFMRPDSADGCLYLAEGVTLTYNGNSNIFHASSRTINICGEGTVVNNGTSPMFAYNGAGRINIFGGNFVQNGEVGMFADNAYASGQTTHVMIYGGTFNVNPATFDADMGYTRTNVALAEGMGTAINEDGNWFVAEKTRICPACCSIVEPDQWEIYTGQFNGTTEGLTAEDGHKHYKLAENYLNNASTVYALKITTGTACFDLAGFDVVRDGSATAAFYNEAGVLNIADTGRDVGGEMVYGTVTGSFDSAIQLGSGAAIVNLRGGTYTKYSTATGGFKTTPVINLAAGGTVNLYDGATITTEGKGNNRGGSCVNLRGNAENKAVFNMYGGVVTIAGSACNEQNSDNPGGAIATGRPVGIDAASNAEVNIYGGTVTGADLANSVGDCIYIKAGTSLTIGGNAVINGEVTMQNENASLTLTGNPQILAQEGGNGLVLNGALANIDTLLPEAQIQISGEVGEVLTEDSQNAATVADSFSVTGEGKTVVDENGQLVIAQTVLEAVMMSLKTFFSNLF